jgi:hypothetical protein
MPHHASSPRAARRALPFTTRALFLDEPLMGGSRLHRLALAGEATRALDAAELPGSRVPGV